jgi:CBS domain-containing protein
VEGFKPNRIGRLVGILAETDFQFSDDSEKTAGEIMSKNVIVASPEIKMDEAYKIMKEKKKKLKRNLYQQ